MYFLQHKGKNHFFKLKNLSIYALPSSHICTTVPVPDNVVADCIQSPQVDLLTSVHTLAKYNALHHGIELTSLETTPSDGNCFINSILINFRSRDELPTIVNDTDTRFYRFTYVKEGIKISCHLEDIKYKSEE